MELVRLTTARLVLEPMAAQHAPLLADFFQRNDTHLRPWDPPRPRGIADAEFWGGGDTARRGRRARRRCRALGAAAAGLLARIIGRVNYTQIVRGPFQSCMLGYAIDAEHEGRGLMYEALECTLGHVFNVLRLHRVQANHLPENQRSARLLQRLGFRVEGLAHEYLYINGAWRDHVLTALTSPSFDASIFRS